jgi:hypothetical protein
LFLSRFLIIPDNKLNFLELFNKTYYDFVLFSGKTEAGQNGAFDAPPKDFELAIDVLRIQLAYLFDPLMAIHTSQVMPLPPQITAV